MKTIDKTSTVVILLAITAGLIGVRTGFWQRLGATISGAAKIKGN